MGRIKDNARITAGRATRVTVMLLLALQGMADPAGSPAPAEPTGAPAATAPATPGSNPETAAPVKLVACYFHGTVRCVTCLEIERESRQVVFQSFMEPLGQGILEWRSVNYDTEPGLALAAPFKLSIPSLVLFYEGVDGKIQRWKNLEQMWDFAGDPGKLREYVQGEVLAMLGQVRPPSAPDH